MSRKRILIIDDDAITCDWISEKLQQIEPRPIIDVRYDGQAGLKVVEEEKFDLVISDTNMPEMSGIEFLQALRERQIQIPVLMMFAIYKKDKNITDQDVLKMGANAVLSKDDIEQHLLKKVLTLIDL